MPRSVKDAFGGAEETGKLLNLAAQEGARDRIGLGEAMGRTLVGQAPGQSELLAVMCGV